jgi:hypothetical protein
MGSQNLYRELAAANLGNLASALADGRAYSTGEHFEDVPNQDTKQVVVQNDSTDTALLIFDPTVRGGASFIVDKAFNPTEDAAGAAPTSGITNKASDGPAATDVTAATGGDNETGAYSGGERFSPKQLGGGTKPSQIAAGAAGDSGAVNLVAPGDSILVEAQNDSGGAANVSIDIDWIAIPTGELDV